MIAQTFSDSPRATLSNRGSAVGAVPRLGHHRLGRRRARPGGLPQRRLVYGGRPSSQRGPGHRADARRLPLAGHAGRAGSLRRRAVHRVQPGRAEAQQRPCARRGPRWKPVGRDLRGRAVPLRRVALPGLRSGRRARQRPRPDPVSRPARAALGRNARGWRELPRPRAVPDAARRRRAVERHGEGRLRGSPGTALDRHQRGRPQSLDRKPAVLVCGQVRAARSLRPRGCALERQRPGALGGRPGNAVDRHRRGRDLAPARRTDRGERGARFAGRQRRPATAPGQRGASLDRNRRWRARPLSRGKRSRSVYQPRRPAQRHRPLAPRRPRAQPVGRHARRAPSSQATEVPGLRRGRRAGQRLRDRSLRVAGRKPVGGQSGWTGPLRSGPWPALRLRLRTGRHRPVRPGGPDRRGVDRDAQRPRAPAGWTRRRVPERGWPAERLRHRASGRGGEAPCGWRPGEGWRASRTAA